MVRHECAPTSCVRPRWFAFPELLSLLLQNSLEAITNANKKHGLRPVLELYTLTDGPCSTQITVTGRWAGPVTPYSRKPAYCIYKGKDKLYWSHIGEINNNITWWYVNISHGGETHPTVKARAAGAPGRAGWGLPPRWPLHGAAGTGDYS